MPGFLNIAKMPKNKFKHEVKIDLNEVKADLNEVKADLNEVKIDLNEVKADLKEVKDTVNRIDQKLEEHILQPAHLLV